MERCDFFSVIKILIQSISEGRSLNQTEFMRKLFTYFSEHDDNIDFEFDNGQVCRWIKGTVPVSPRIVEFYLNCKNAEYLSLNIEDNILPLFYDSNMTAQNLYNLVISDVSISEQKKSELTASYPCEETADIADFICAVLLFAMERKFVKRDEKLLTTSGTLSPIASDRIFDGTVPKPCKYFCGRDKELAELHELLNHHSKIFINGIAGIGKSEFVKAYADEYKKSYTNILYFTYSGSLQSMIFDMDFADDLLTDDEQTRFKKHNRFLRSLKEDTLIIIDNFNISASKEPLLDIVMKYNCRIVFTTRSRFEIGYTYELNEISDINILTELTGKFYFDAESNRSTVVNIIEIIHRHTLSVEMSARLLQKGLFEPNEVLRKLSECHVNPDTSDKISITKDGTNIKATYYSHIQALFSLFLLDGNMQFIMRCMTFIPLDGIRARLFAKWLALPDLNAVNDLIELGFIQNNETDKISLHPLVQEITVADLKPSYLNCQPFINSIHHICLRHGEDVPYYKTLFSVIENIINTIENDSPTDYLLFIEDAFSYMEKYRYKSGMLKIIAEMSELLKDENIGTANDRALLLNNSASFEGLLNGNYKKAIELEKKAIAVCVADENIVLVANLHMNLGYLYQYSRDFDNAKLFMKHGIDLLSQSGIVTNDIIIMVHNYARLLAETGEPQNALKALSKCAKLVKAVNTEKSADYADLVFDMAVINFQLGNSDIAKNYFIEAFGIYKAILPQEDLNEKVELAGKYLNRSRIASVPDYLSLK